MYAISIAGFDPSGGAGVLLDLKVFSLLGIRGGGVITALTLQNTSTFLGWEPVERRYVEKVLDLLFSDVPVKGVKIGMVPTPEVLEVVVFYLKKHRNEISYIVYDPVLRATLGYPLIASSQMLFTIKKELLPLVDTITPNLEEASLLTEIKISSSSDLRKAAKTLLKLGCKSVVITGYSSRGNVYDFLCGSSYFLSFSKKLLNTEFHGTGCAFSSALLCFLLKGFSKIFAFKKAKNWLYLYLKKAQDFPIGGRLCLFL